MKIRSLFVATLIAFTALALAPFNADARTKRLVSTYEVIDLGPSIFANGGISDNQQIVYTAEYGGQPRLQVATYRGRTLKVSQSENWVFGHSINNRGEIAGATISTSLEPFVWLPRCGRASLFERGTADAISNTGFVTGSYDSPAQTGQYSYVWKDGNLTVLQEGGGYAVNDRGDVAGYSGNTADIASFRPCVWYRNQHKATQIGGEHGYAYGINRRGDVVGSLGMQPFVYKRSGRITKLQFDFPGTGAAYAVNDAGTVVGTYSGRAFIWHNGRMQDLNDLVPVPASVIISARDINNRGDILALTRMDDGLHRLILKKRGRR